MCFKKHCKEITYIDVKVKRLNFTNQTEIIKVPFLDPDTVMQYLINAGLTIPQEQVVEFWENKRHSGETWVENCPATNQHIPIAIYGDACRLYTARKDSKYLGIFISLPLWRPRSTRYSRWCIFSIEVKKNFMEHKPCIRFCKGLHTNWTCCLKMDCWDQMVESTIFAAVRFGAIGNGTSSCST